MMIGTTSISIGDDTQQPADPRTVHWDLVVNGVDVSITTRRGTGGRWYMVDAPSWLRASERRDLEHWAREFAPERAPGRV